MIGLNYTSLALWRGMGPAFSECGRKRSWVPKQNEDSVRRKDEESDCCIDNDDCDPLFRKWFSCQQMKSLTCFYSPIFLPATSNATYLDLKFQPSQIRIIYYKHKTSLRGQLNSLFKVCSNSNPFLITPLLHGFVHWAIEQC